MLDYSRDKKNEARNVEGMGEKSLLSGPGSGSRTARAKEERKREGYGRGERKKKTMSNRQCVAVKCLASKIEFIV